MAEGDSARAKFCSRCGASMQIIVVPAPTAYDSQTGKALGPFEKRWDCRQGMTVASLGFEGGHSSPHAERLGRVAGLC